MTWNGKFYGVPNYGEYVMVYYNKDMFAAHNVIKDAPFTRVDLISCRNLLIYFDRPTQARAVGTALRIRACP